MAASLFIISCVVFPPKVYAYLDSCTGSFVIQIILASLLGIIFAIKIYWKQLKASLTNLFFKQRKKTK
jgi:hypothetical protein